MTTEHTPVPEYDAIAHAARHALGALAGSAAITEPSWAAVESSARHAQRRRLSVLGAVMAIIVVGAGTAVAEVANRGGHDLHVAGAGPSSEPSSEPTTDAPYNSSSAPGTTTGGVVVTGPGGTAGPTTTVTLPSAAPQAGDVTGTIDLAGSYLGASGQREAPVGAAILVQTTIHNTSGRTIWASNGAVPTSLATICTPESADPSRSLWWMTNIALAPGDTDARSGTFTPTAAYVGTVRCELDVIAPAEGQVVNFDAGAGGDAANALIVGRVTNVDPVTITIVAGHTSTTLAYGTATTVAAP